MTHDLVSFSQGKQTLSCVLQTMAPQPQNILSFLPSETLIPSVNFRLFQRPPCLGGSQDNYEPGSQTSSGAFEQNQLLTAV